MLIEFRCLLQKMENLPKEKAPQEKLSQEKRPKKKVPKDEITHYFHCSHACKFPKLKDDPEGSKLHKDICGECKEEKDPYDLEHQIVYMRRALQDAMSQRDQMSHFIDEADWEREAAAASDHLPFIKEGLIKASSTKLTFFEKMKEKADEKVKDLQDHLDTQLERQDQILSNTEAEGAVRMGLLRAFQDMCLEFEAGYNHLLSGKNLEDFEPLTPSHKLTEEESSSK